MTIDKAESEQWIKMSEWMSEQDRLYAEQDMEHEYKMANDPFYKKEWDSQQKAIEAAMERTRKLYRDVKFD